MSTVLLSIAVNALLIGLVYFLAKRRINRLLNGGEALDAIKEEINHLIVELNQTADRNIGIIEERINKLQELVRDADKKIMLLGKESEKLRLGTDVYDKLKKSKSLISEGASREADLKAGLEGTRESKGETVTVTAKKISNMRPRPAPSAVQRETERPKPVTLADEVLALHRQGLDTKIIAAKTGSPLGEIELIISLAEGTR